MPTWLQTITALPKRACEALESVWDFIAQPEQETLQKKIMEQAAAADEAEQRVLAELEEQEMLAGELIGLVEDTEKMTDDLETRFRLEDEDSASLQTTEAALDSFSDTQDA